MRKCLQSLEIKHVKGASWCQNATDFTQRLLPLVRGEMVEHEGGGHPIERSIGIWQFIGKALIEFDSDCCSSRLSSGSDERLRIRIESDDHGIRMKAFDQHRQRARATADIEDTMSALDGRMIEKRPPCRIATKQLHEGIIE